MLIASANRRFHGSSITSEIWKFAPKKYTVEEVSRDEQNFKKLLAQRIDYLVTSDANGVFLINQMVVGSGELISLRLENINNVFPNYLFQRSVKKTCMLKSMFD